MSSQRDLILKLLQCNVVKFGNFKLKSGAFSPIYIDLRQIVNYPSVVKDLAFSVHEKLMDLELKVAKVCGVPYTALPIASVFSVLYDIPMVMKRKEAKDHGTKKLIEGNWNPGDKCLIIEDIVSSGTSIIETTEALRKEGMTIEDCIVIIDRKQGGLKNAKEVGVTIHPLIDIDDIISAYKSTNDADPELLENIQQYFDRNRSLPVFYPANSKLPFVARAKESKHALAKTLFELMEEKKTNLCVAVDTFSSDHLLQRAEELGPHICMLKTHIDMLKDFSPDVSDKLKNIACYHKFLIMEDRKFADIGSTVKTQYIAGIYKISEWADLVTVHAIPGEGIIEALKSSQGSLSKGCVLVAEMSSKGTLTDESYRDKVFKMAETHSDFVVGYVSQSNNQSSKAMIHMCPGVNLESAGDSLGQQYRTVEDAIKSGADIIIVGRGIDKSKDVVTAAIEYKTRGYNAYLSLVK